MTHHDHFTGETLMQSARRDRNEVFVKFGQIFFLAPVRLVRSGLNDIRRYRRPIKTV